MLEIVDLLKLGLVAALLGGAFLLGLMNWRWGVLFCLVFLLIEGALRKWLLPDFHQWIYFVKDSAILGAYLHYFGGRIRAKLPLFPYTPFNTLLGALVVWGTLETFNPSLPNLRAVVLGMKGYIFYVPLLFMGRDLFSSKAELLTFLRRYVSLSVPLTILGIIQYYSPPNSIINRFGAWHPLTVPSPGFFVEGLGPFVRVASSFSYLTGYATYLSVLLLLLLALLQLREISWRWRVAMLAIFLLALISLPMLGSRFALGVFLVNTAIFLTWNWRVSFDRHLKRMTLLAIAILILLGLTIPPVRTMFSAIWGRTISPDQLQDIRDRTLSFFVDPVQWLDEAGLVGHGIGSTHQGAQVGWGRGPEGLEGETDRVLLELGGIGFILYYLLRISLIFELGRIARSLRDADLRSLAIGVFLLHLSHLPVALVFNHVFLVFYWFLAGCAISLLPLEEQERVKVAESRVRPG